MMEMMEMMQMTEMKKNNGSTNDLSAGWIFSVCEYKGGNDGGEQCGCFYFARG